MICCVDPEFDNPTWVPSDYDVSLLCESIDGFLIAVADFAQYLARYDQMLTMNRKTMRYFGDDKVVHLVEFIVRSVHKPITLIFRPGITNPETLLDSFDISVCKVGYSFDDDHFYVQNTVRVDIQRHIASVKPFWFPNNVPTEAELNLIVITLRRMKKYGARGYRFPETAPDVRFGPRSMA